MAESGKAKQREGGAWSKWASGTIHGQIDAGNGGVLWGQWGYGGG